MILNSIKNGFDLVIKSPVLIFWAFILSLPMDALFAVIKDQSGFNNLFAETVLTIINLAQIFFINTAFYFILPKFWLLKQERKDLNAQIILGETLKTAKRIFWRLLFTLVSLALKNLDFVLLISFQGAIILAFYQQYLVNQNWGSLATWPFYTFLGLIFSVAVLYFYQSKKIRTV